MPISLSISHEDKRLIAEIEGGVTLVEGMKALATLFAQGAVPYAKVIDLNYAPLAQGLKGIRQISDRVAQLARGRNPGPLAFVVRSDLAREMIDTFEAQLQSQVEVRRPREVFTDRASAVAWLDELANLSAAGAVAEPVG